jgi:plastocyanin
MGRMPGMPLLVLAATLAGVAYAADAPAAPVVVETGADGVQRATITVDSYSFEPDHLVVSAGRPVELTLISVTRLVPHDFVIDDPAFGPALHQEIGAGETAKVTFTPERTGTFAFYCSKDPPLMKSHRAKGMEGILAVRP